MLGIYFNVFYVFNKGDEFTSDMNKIYMNDYFMVDFIFSNFDSWRYNCELVKIKNIFVRKQESFFIAVLRKRIFPLFYLLWLMMYKYIRCFTSVKKNNKKPSEYNVIYFDIESMEYIAHLLSINFDAKRHILWLWNPVASLGKNRIDKCLYIHIYMRLLKLFGVEIWTFDPNDANRYNLEYHPQVYLDESNFYCNPCSSGNFNFECGYLFIGQDKGRLDNLIKLNNELRLKNTQCTMFVIADENKEYTTLQAKYIMPNSISYQQYLSMLQSHIGVIDYSQCGQSGLTLRVLEALFLKKKIITNNADIVNYDFYKPENIFVFNEDRVGGALERFLEVEFIPVDSKILQRYTIESLISCMLQKEHK